MEAELRQKMVLAREHYRHHEYDRAEPLLRQVIAEHPGSAEMFNMLGVILHDRGLFTEAQQLFEQALHINPGYTEVALSLSIVYNDMGHYDKARETYQKAMAKVSTQPRQLDPFASGKLANMHADLAEAYRGLGLYEEAAIELRAALRLHPSFCDLHCQLAMVLSSPATGWARSLATARPSPRTAITPRPTSSSAQSSTLWGCETRPAPPGSGPSCSRRTTSASRSTSTCCANPSPRPHSRPPRTPRRAKPDRAAYF